MQFKADSIYDFLYKNLLLGRGTASRMVNRAFEIQRARPLDAMELEQIDSEKHEKKHYQVPDYLEGNVWETKDQISDIEGNLARSKSVRMYGITPQHLSSKSQRMRSIIN